MRTLEVEIANCKDQVHRAYSPSPKDIHEAVYEVTIGDSLGEVRAGVESNP